MFKKINVVFLIVISSLLSSCKQTKNIAYYQNIDTLQTENSPKFQSMIQEDDLLLIIVSAEDPEAAAPFNLELVNLPTVIGQANAVGQKQHQLYLVDNNAEIDFPVLGKLKVGGKSKEEFTNTLKEKIKKYVNNPIVNVRIMNYKVSVQGEVTRPGSYTINSERITLPEALSLAGDLTIYGKRNNIVVVREKNGKKTIGRVDLTKSDFINSPFYYLSQNDLVYVEPNNAKANSSTFNQNIPVWISLSSVLISLVLLFKK